MKKIDMIEELSKRLDIEQDKSKEYLDGFIEQISNHLEDGMDLHFSKFGNFIIRHKKERMGRIIKTMENRIVTARKVVSFKPSPFLKKREHID